jgi:hypothetical protein
LSIGKKFHQYFISNNRDPILADATTRDGQAHQLRIEHRGFLDLNQYLNVGNQHIISILDYMNSMMKHVLREKDFEQVGRLPKFFHPRERTRVEGQELDAWPGYSVKSIMTPNGYFLNEDCSTKFVRRTSVL